MTDQEFEGAARNVAGKIQGAVGALSGDAAEEMRGKIREAAGSVQATAGAALNNARNATASNPVGAILTAAAAGFILGALFARRH